eukprot:6488498-Amphidinium_carterae.4
MPHSLRQPLLKLKCWSCRASSTRSSGGSNVFTQSISDERVVNYGDPFLCMKDSGRKWKTMPAVRLTTSFSAPWELQYP